MRTTKLNFGMNRVATPRRSVQSAGSGARGVPKTLVGASTPRSAFTLIELLVVVGLVVVLVGATGLALAGRGGEGAALSNAQSIVSGMVGATRAQAALHQTTARLLVYARPPTMGGDAAKYLRTLQVVRQETPTTGAPVWVAVGDPVTLPTPICVVPSSVPSTHLRLPAGQTWNNNAATGPVSTLRTETVVYRGQSTATATQYFGVSGPGNATHYLEFNADGTVSSNPTGNPTKIALATAILSGSGFPLFNNPSAVRGVVVRKSGAVAMVNQATGF